MDRLESCYFCGTGDGSLDEYPVVPDALSPSPDEQATVTLCPSCRRKLGDVVKRIAAAAEGAAASSHEPPAETGPDGSSPTPDPSGSDQPTESTRGSGSRSSPLGGESTDGEPTADPSEDTDEGAEDPAGDPTPDAVSPFQYNKVMRLLENRDFPVSVDEFQSIATSAYQLEPADVNAVIQAAIDRGLIERGEDGEMLHRAE